MAPRLYDIQFTALRWWAIALALVATIAFLVAIDKLCGLFVSKEYESHTLVLPPSETVRYEFRDFQFTVSINRLGFRGPELPLHRTPSVKRIIVLGNSFTYGWGVDFEDTWPRRLEKELNAAGVPVEVANVSRPGTTSLEIRDIAARAIDLLKPDLVLISVLQGGALTTLQGGLAPDPVRERPKNVRAIMLDRLSHVFPNYVKLLQFLRERTTGMQFIPASRFQREQIKAAETLIRGLTAEGRKRFFALDPATVDRFTNGALNAGIVMLALDNPNLWVDTVESTKMIETGVAGMTDAFSGIRMLGEQSGVRAIVTSMPYGAFLAGGGSENLRRLGFNIPEYLARDGSTEEQIRRSADAAGVQFVSVLDGFRAVSSDDLFIPFDGHFSAAGAKLFAKLLAPKLIRGSLLEPPRPEASVPAAAAASQN